MPERASGIIIPFPNNKRYFGYPAALSNIKSEKLRIDCGC